MSPRSLRFDRVFPGVGRIQRASGTSRRSTFAQMDAMLLTLYGAARLDLLGAIRDGRIPALQVFDAYRRGRLEELPTLEGLLPLDATLTTWLAGMDCSAWHRQSLRQSQKRLLSAGGFDDAVSTLPGRVAALRGVLRPRTFNVTRSAALAFLRDTVGRASLLYTAVRGVPAKTVQPTYLRRPQSPRELLDAPLDAETKATCMALASTGMGPKEFWEDGWERKLGYLHIHGRKRKGRDRKVPDVGGLCVSPRISRQVFEDRLHDCGQFTPYDLRRSYANWLEAARIPRTRRMLYLGHGPASVTDLYEWHEISAFLRSDGETLKRWIGEQIAAPVPHSVPIVAS